MAKSVILNELISSLDLKPYSFEQAIGVGIGTITKAIARNSDISIKTVEAIKAKFPNVNREWLLTGQPPMLLKQYNINQSAHVNELREPNEPYEQEKIADIGNNPSENDNPVYQDPLQLLTQAALNNSRALEASAQAHLINARNIKRLINILEGDRVLKQRLSSRL